MSGQGEPDPKQDPIRGDPEPRDESGKPGSNDPLNSGSNQADDIGKYLPPPRSDHGEDPMDYQDPLDEESREAVEETVRAKRIRNYGWSTVLDGCLVVPDLHDGKPMQGKQRKQLMDGIPDFSERFRCVPLSSLGEDRRLASEGDRWFLEKAVPKIHAHILDELNILAFVLQESQDGDGSRVGLSETDLRGYLETVIKLKIDTLQLLAAMQVQRAHIATRRIPPPTEEQKEKSIISERAKLESAKRAETAAQEKKGVKRRRTFGFFAGRQSGNFGRGTRRPRYAPLGLSSEEPSLTGRVQPFRSARGGRSNRARGARGRGYPRAN